MVYEATVYQSDCRTYIDNYFIISTDSYTVDVGMGENIDDKLHTINDSKLPCGKCRYCNIYFQS